MTWLQRYCIRTFVQRLVGMRDLSTGKVCDGAGQLRLMYRTPDWEEFVSLAVTEIRLYGAGSIQVPHRPLQRSGQRAFQDSEDHAFAETADSQGVGGAR